MESTSSTWLGDAPVNSGLAGAELEVGLYASKCAMAQADGTVLARDLANGRSDDVTPDRLVQVAESIAEVMRKGGARAAVRCIRGVDALRAEGMEMFAAVGQGASPASAAPCLVWIEYDGTVGSSSGSGADGPAWFEDEDEETGHVTADAASTSSSSSRPQPFLCLGKAITFDTGGLNLKPSGSIGDMHLDMGGGAASLGAALAVGRMQLPVRAVFAAACAENAIGPDAYKPHAILHSRRGISVHNNNCDAEGRLVLADALDYLQEKCRPHTVVDLATLTGACVAALGEYAAGMFTNSDPLAARLREVGVGTHERVWRMPILPEHADQLVGKSGKDHADLLSTGDAGACTAAAFLRRFIGPREGQGTAGSTRDGDSNSEAGDEEDNAIGEHIEGGGGKVAWAHIDIAGPGMRNRPDLYFRKGGTGFGAALVSEYLRLYGEGGRPGLYVSPEESPVLAGLSRSGLRQLVGVDLGARGTEADREASLRQEGVPMD